MSNKAKGTMPLKAYNYFKNLTNELEDKEVWDYRDYNIWIWCLIRYTDTFKLTEKDNNELDETLIRRAQEGICYTTGRKIY